MGLPNKCGVGLRHPHIAYVCENTPQVPWFEVHSENFFPENDRLEETQTILKLQRIAQNYPLSFHGVGLSIGSAQPLEREHLCKLKETVDFFRPRAVSEHLSWSSFRGRHFNDLLPLPYTDESFRLFCDKTKEIQDFLGRRILIENPSTYIAFKESTIREWDFYAGLPSKCGCGLLLDLNNIVVNAHNHRFSPSKYLESVDPSDVEEIHLAGHCRKPISKGNIILIDDHGSRVTDDVLALYEQFLLNSNDTPTLIEWDTNIPDFEILLAESRKAQTIADRVTATRIIRTIS